MKKINLLLILLACVFMTSCASFYKMIGMSPEETHKYAVVKAKDVVYAYIDKRVEKTELSSLAKAELKIAIKEIVDDAFEKLDKVYREKTQKELEDAGKSIVDAELDDGTVIIEVTPVDTPDAATVDDVVVEQTTEE